MSVPSQLANVAAGGPRLAGQTASPRGARRRRAHRILPGFGLSLGFTLLYLAAMVFFPLGGLAWKTATLTWPKFLATITEPRVVHAFGLSFGAALTAALLNAGMGLVVAWTLVRYEFPGRRLVDALIDLPFALPTAVAGIALTGLYAEEGWLGRPLAALGLKVAFTWLGVVVALIFIGLPFVVRTLQPVIEDLEPAIEEAAGCLGATRGQTFRRVLLPELVPALVAGFVLAFARGLGEYGSVIFISGNLPMRTEIVPLLIVTKLEQYDYAGATAIALVMLLASLALIFAVNAIERRQRARGLR